MATNYTQLKHFSNTTTTSSTSLEDNNAYGSDGYGVPLRPAAHGRARSKRLCDWIDSLALSCSFACLVVCIVVATPSLPYAWRLGYNNQLIVLGFMLAIMNLCNRRIATRFFVIIEARWGGSTLQNFDAILRQSVWVAQTSVHWIVTFLALTALPLGLGVAYKSFVGGTATQPSHDISVEQYGVFTRPYNKAQKATPNAARDAMLGFFNAAMDDDVGPTYAEAPQPFGYNQLLIDEGTMAVLDMPNSTILATIQERLGLGESLTISANVQGTVSVYNTSTPQLLKDDDLWDYFYQLHTLETYHAYRMGISFSSYLVDAFVWLGGYLQTCGVLPAPYLCDDWYAHYSNVNDSDVDAFRASNMTLLFNIYRQPCSATWNVTSSAVSLLSGNCTDVRNPNRFQNVEGNMMPVIGDALDVVGPTLWDFIPDRPNSPWRVPSYAALAATSYWARWYAYGRTTAVNNPDLGLSQDFVYNVTDEKINSTKLTLHARPWLYVVLAIQPVLTTVFLVLTMCFFSTPVDSGFGLTSILASINKDSLDSLRGAGLSGQLTRRLHLNIAVAHPEGQSYLMEQGYRDGMIQSRLGLSKESRREGLRPGAVYG